MVHRGKWIVKRRDKSVHGVMKFNEAFCYSSLDIALK